MLYQQPTTLRWQLREVLDEFPHSERSQLDPFNEALVAVLSDDPHAALKAVRAGFATGGYRRTYGTSSSARAPPASM